MKRRLSRRHIPMAATLAVFAALYGAACIRYEGFFSLTVLINLFQDNAYLGLAAIGMTFVILSGGIDLSVGAVVGLTSISVATLIEIHGLHPMAAMTIAMLVGVLFGAGQGGIIAHFRLPPFLVTLAGMFLARGLAFVIRIETLSIRHHLYDAVADFSYRAFPVSVLVYLLAMAVAMYGARYTRFGRAVYALGGNESSAMLMGLPVVRVKILTYGLSGLCAACAGVIHTFYTSAGNPAAGSMLELDAIASVVMGGTLLQGGVGHPLGTFVGVLILGVIQTGIAFEGTLSSWWTKIAIGGLLLAFILLQRLVQVQASQRRPTTPPS